MNINGCLFIVETGVSLKIARGMQGMEKFRGSDPLCKLPERLLLLSKAPCCQRPAGSSPHAGSLAGKESTAVLLTKSSVYFPSL